MFYLVAPFMSRPIGHVYIEARHQYLHVTVYIYDGAVA